MQISNAVKKEDANGRRDEELPEDVKLYMSIRDSMQVYHFHADAEGRPVNVVPKRMEELKLSGKYTYIFNGFDRHSFASWVYRDSRRDGFEDNDKWLPRLMAEYHTTALWCSCRFLKEYIDSFGTGNIKHKAALVIKSSNWADIVKQHLGEKLLKKITGHFNPFGIDMEYWD